ncbi:16S rRNA (uracil(1498)-N(3))-methyltransferase [Litorimonas sp. RW-G-Af-16]
MRENYTLPRLYLDQALSRGAEIDLPKEQAHYLVTVIRKSNGDQVRVFNGEYGEWQAEITAATKRAVTLTIGKQLRSPKASPDVTLYFAPVRKHRTAFIIEKATELGVRKMQPVITARTQFPKLNLDKAKAQAIEAAEQTERLDVPDILPPVKLDAAWLNNVSDCSLIFADEAGDCGTAMEVLQNLRGAAAILPAAILVGPEGGFTDAERGLLRSQDFVRPVSLGPRILRADTAALSLLTLWQAVCGDWE